MMREGERSLHDAGVSAVSRSAHAVAGRAPVIVAVGAVAAIPAARTCAGSTAAAGRDVEETLEAGVQAVVIRAATGRQVARAQEGIRPAHLGKSRDGAGGSAPGGGVAAWIS